MREVSKHDEEELRRIITALFDIVDTTDDHEVALAAVGGVATTLIKKMSENHSEACIRALILANNIEDSLDDMFRREGK
jgi:hypothetical protein